MIGWRARIGLVVPANNTVIEPELYGLERPGVSYHAARVIGSRGSSASVDSLRTIVEGVSGALESLAIAGVDAVVYACLSTSLANPGWEERFRTEADTIVGVPAVTAYAATVQAMRESGARRWLVVTPYGGSVQELVAAALTADELTVAATRSLDEPGLRAVCRIAPRRVYRFVRDAAADAGTAFDGVAVLATDLQTFAVDRALGEDLGVPIVTTNRAIAWAAERLVAAAKEKGELR